MKHHNLDDPQLAPTQRWVRDLQGASPNGFSALTRGQMRFASDESLLVEGSMVGSDNVELGIPAHMDWRGTAVFKGGLSVGVGWNSESGGFVVGDYLNKRISTFNGNTYHNGNAYHNESVMVDANAAADNYLRVGTTDNPIPTYINGDLTTRGDIRMFNLLETDTPDDYNVLMVNVNGFVFKGPKVGGIGGGGETNPGDPSGTGLVKPFPWSTVTSEFGPRESPGGIGSTYHEGIDFGYWPAAAGAAIGSAGPGIASFVGYSGGWGNLVVIDHGGGIKTYYAHMSGFAVSPSQSVNQGQTLGWIGSTGNSTGPHLHMEVRVNDVAMNPRNYLV